MRFGSGEITGRNAFLIHAALLSCPRDVRTISLAVHSGTTYRDCSPDFIAVMEHSLDFHTHGSVKLTAPFLDFTKADIVALARSRLAVRSLPVLS